MQPEPAQIYRARVMHARVFPVRYRFIYRVFYLLLDIDRIAQSTRRLRLLSQDRFNLFGFYERDHGPRDGSPLRPWVEGLLGRRGIGLEGGRISLLCMPRVLGYVFNPLSIYYCEHADGSLRAILCQVHNTFGEQHCYLLEQGGAPLEGSRHFEKEKVFHVSPLMDIAGGYRFALDRPGARLRVLIRVFQQGELMLTTTLTGRRRALTDRNLLGCFLRIPLMTVKVIGAIHWQALKIWLRGAPFFQKPQPPAEEMS